MTDGMDFPATTWHVDSVVTVTDGDTVRMIRSRIIDFDGRAYVLTDSDPRGIPHRLVWVDTPERGDIRWNQARQDLRQWIDTHGPLRAVVYGSAGWDRLLVDLLDVDGNSASQYMMAVKDWAAYTP